MSQGLKKSLTFFVKKYIWIEKDPDFMHVFDMYVSALFYIMVEKEGIWMFTKKVFISSLSIMFALSGISVVQAQNTGRTKNKFRYF